MTQSKSRCTSNRAKTFRDLDREQVRTAYYQFLFLVKRGIEYKRIDNIKQINRDQRGILQIEYTDRIAVPSSYSYSELTFEECISNEPLLEAIDSLSEYQ